MASAQSPGRVPWHTLIILFLTIALVWWFLRSIDLREAWRATLGAEWGWIALAVLITIQTYVIRAWRWRVLLAPHWSGVVPDGLSDDGHGVCRQFVVTGAGR